MSVLPVAQSAETGTCAPAATSVNGTVPASATLVLSAANISNLIVPLDKPPLVLVTPAAMRTGLLAA